MSNKYSFCTISANLLAFKMLYNFHSSTNLVAKYDQESNLIPSEAKQIKKECETKNIPVAILHLIEQNNEISIYELAKVSSKGQTTIKKHLKGLKKKEN